MKKIIKNNIFGFLIGIILYSGVVYAANLYKAVDVKYDPTDTSWEVSNVNDALNDLYDKQKNSTKKALVFTASPVDMTQYTDRWSELTTADFKVGASGCSANINFNTQISYAFNKTAYASTNLSYNNKTGVLTFSASGSSETLNNSNTAYQLNPGLQNVFAVWLGTIGGE